MKGFLLIAPTGSGKSWACLNDEFYRQFAIDGDTLISWPEICSQIDWKVKDREHLNIVLGKMQETGKCICWFVGTTAIADAIDEGRLSKDAVGIVLLPEHEHYPLVLIRGKEGHDWNAAIKHRNLCETLIQKYGLKHFSSFKQASAYLRCQFNFLHASQGSI